MTLVLASLTVYYGIVVFSYWWPLWAVRTLSEPVPPPDPPASAERPRLVVIAPCRLAAASIPGMVSCIKAQDYPLGRFRLIILIDSDDSSDPAAAVARAAGAEVYVRLHPAIKTKGAALNELFQTHLQHEPWDAVTILDIDARVHPHFLTRVAAYLARGARVIQGAQRSKNAEESPVSRINHAAQWLSQIAQQGRARLGLSAVLSGGCMVLSRESLERLGWQTSTGERLSDDGELNLRCALQDIPVTYGPDIQLFNDLPADYRATRLQRRRWSAAYAQMGLYLWPLLRKGMTSRPGVLERAAAVLLIPSCSTSYVLAGLAVGLFGILSTFNSHWIGWFSAVAMLWVFHTAYYVVALRTGDGFLRWQEFKSLPLFLWMRMVAIFDGFVLANRSNAGRYAIPSQPKERN